MLKKQPPASQAFTKIAFTLASLAAAGAVAAQTPSPICTAQSPAHRVALLELYTSEGCDSCPPADAWLADAGKQLKPSQAIPLSLHVDYWDYIGWKDRFAAPAFGARHRALVQSAGKKTVYTPQVFASGSELQSWRTPAQMQASVGQINAQKAMISLKLSQTAPHQVQLAWSQPATATPHQLYIAVVEDGLVSNVTQGENKGATLHHASVVRGWHGPFASQQAASSVQQTIKLPSDAVQSRLRVVAFAQDARTAEVAQAVSLGACAPL